MKLILLSLMTFSVLASGALKPEFKESSFNYRSQNEIDSVKYCYDVTKSDQVCVEIYERAQKMNVDYLNGSHDFMEVDYCQPNPLGTYYLVSYRLGDDYGGNFAVKRTIAPCEE